MVRVIYLIIWVIYKIATMTFESAITIILTALAVMLAVLAIGIGVIAVWGYIGLRDSVKDAATKHVAMAMDRKLREYPPAASLVELVGRMEAGLGHLDRIQKQMVIGPETKDLAIASKPGIEEEKAKSGLNVAKIETYPGEEAPNADTDPK